MKKITVLFFIFSFWVTSNVAAQLVYQKMVYELPAPRFSHLYNTEEAIDAGYILSGGTSTTTNLAGFIFIAKIDELGDTVWTRRYDGPEYEYGYVKNLYDSSYVVYGKLYSFNTCDTDDLFLMKLKADGDTLWTRHYGTCYPDFPQELIKGPNSGYYFLENLDVATYSFGSALLRLNAQGDTVWTRSINVTGDGKNQNYSCSETSDGGLIICGSVYDTAVPYSSYLIKIDSSGNLQWDKYIDSPYFNQTYQVIQTSNGYYIIGMCNLGGTLGSGTMLLKTDFNGNPLWGKMYENIIIGLKPATLLNDGNIFIPGIKRHNPMGPGQYFYDLLSLKTDSTGNLLWSKKYVTNQLSFGAYSSINSLQTNDNGFLITTTSTIDSTYNTYNGLLVKIDSLGNGCSDSSLAVNVIDITAMIMTSDTITPLMGYYPVTVGRSPFNYYGSGINYTDLCNGYLGIEGHFLAENEINVYPNPTMSKVTIAFDIKTPSYGSIEITNIWGQSVKTISQHEYIQGNNSIEIDLGQLQRGLYFLRMERDGKNICKKIIKQ